MKNKPLLALVAVVLILSTLIGVVPVGAAEPSDKNDFTLPGATVNTVSAADVLMGYLGSPIAKAERDYIEKYSDVKIKYSDGVTTAMIIAMITSDGLDVRANEYSYTASNGKTVRWIPDTAELFGEQKSLVKDSDGSYYTTFSDIGAANASTAVNVTYYLDISVDAETLDSVANLAYTDAPRLRDELAARQAEFESNLSDFIERERAYNDYIIANDNYEKQLADHLIWKKYNDEMAAFEYYQTVTLPTYNAQVKAHYDSIDARDNFLKQTEAWAAWESRLADYNNALLAHEKYLSDAAPYLSQLAAMDFVNLKMTDLSRSLYWAIHGTVVTSVLEQRDSLEGLAGVPGAVIDLAEGATLRLRPLLADYVTITDDATKYLYYKQNYEELKKEFINLFVSLDFLYRNGTVRGIIKKMSDAENDRNRKYQILLAQLFVMVNLLSDTEVKSIDPSYLVGTSVAGSYKQYTYGASFRIDPDHKYTVDQVLGGEEYPTDKNSATPYSKEFPVTVPHPGDAPTTDLTDPGDTPPAYIPMPDPIDEVLKPEGDAPSFVAHPGDPITPVDHPGTPPTAYIPPREVTALLDIADSIPHRDIPASTQYLYRVTKTVAKKFIDVETVTVAFYDTDGQKRLYTATVDRGSAIAYAGPYAPTKPEDDRAVYVFDGWMAEGTDGKMHRVDLGAISSDLVLYPYFEEIIKEYTVTWNTDSGTENYTLPYGTLPVYNGNTAKPDDTLYTYAFDGWDTDPVPVTKNAVYTAKYTSEYILPTTEGGARVELSGNEYIADFRQSADKSFLIAPLLSRAAGKCSVKIITRYSTFTLTADVAKSLAGQGACRVFLETSSDGGRNYYRVVITDNADAPLASDLTVGLTVSVSHTASDRLKLSYQQPGGTRAYSAYVLDSHTLTVRATPSVLYTFGYEYRVETINNPLADVIAENTVYYAGDTVTVAVTNPDTVRIKRMYYKTSDGESVDISGNSFVMPRSDVTVFADAEYLTYRITFVSDGHTLTVLTCKVGEIPTLPENPRRASDGKFTYEFVGWSPSVSIATSDATYEALFDAHPIIEQGDTGRGITLYMLINMALAGVFGIFFIAIPASVISAVKMKRFKKELFFDKKEKNKNP